MPQVVEPLRGAPEPAPGRIRWTRRQCEAIQEAGVLTGRYELIDGVLVVSPSPSMPHQSVLFELAVRLRKACPEQLKVYVAPLDVTYGDDTVLQPDVLVVDRPVAGQLKLTSCSEQGGW